MWHVQSNPETISVIPAIAQELVRLPDDGHLPPAFQGVRAAWFGEAATGTYCGADFATLDHPQTPENGCTSTHVQTGTLTSPSFSLAGRTSAVLTFQAWWEIEAVHPDVSDLMRVEYTTDGGATWITAAALNPLDRTGDGRHDSRTSYGWRSYTADLTPAAGQSDVRLRFVFDTVDELRNGFRGLLVDNVAVVNELGAPITQPTGTFTDTPPELAITHAELVQAPSGSWFVQFTVAASYPVPHDVGFDWTVVGQSGTQVGSGHGTLTTGQTQADFVVPVSGADAPYTIALSNASGATIGTAGTATATVPSPAPGLPAVGIPDFKKSFGVGAISGTVRYRTPGGKFVTLGAEAVTLPLGSVVDATNGHALITVASDAQGTPQTVEIWDGKVGIFQSGKPAVGELRLAGGNYKRCATTSRKRARASGSTTIRRLWASGKGRFRTKGRYASATVRGTKWLTQDLCSATRVRVVEGVVAVRDFRRHRTLTVRAGHQVTVTAARSARYRNRRGSNRPG
jgi:Immune inhibitor A peptidase M6